MEQNTINYGEPTDVSLTINSEKMVGKMVSMISKIRRQETIINKAYAMQIVGYESFCDNFCYSGGLVEALEGFLQKFRSEGWEHEESFVKGWNAAQAIYKTDGVRGLLGRVFDIHNGAELFDND